MNKKLKRKQALIMAEPYRTPFNSKVAKVSGDVIEDSVGGIKYATSFDGATKIVDANKNKIKIKDGVYTFGKSVNLIKFDDVENITTKNGMTYSIKDGVITFSGTPIDTNKGLTLYFNPISINVGDIYSIALFNQFTSSLGFFIQDKSNSGEGNINLGINENIAKTWTVKAGSQYEAIVIYLDSTKTYTNEVIKPILVSGSTIPTKYYSGSYGIKIEVVDGVMTCNGMMQTNETLYTDLENKIYSGTYSFNSFASNETRCDMYLSSPQTQIYNSNNLNLQSTNGFDKISFFMIANTDYDNLILKPMLVLGTTAPTEFEPNFKNLLELEDKEETTINGITYSIKDGVITFSGTATADTAINLKQGFPMPTGSYGLYTGSTSYFKIWNNTLGWLTNKKVITTTSDDSYGNILIFINIGKVVDDVIETPTLTKGKIIPTQFIPFANPYFVSLGQNGSVQYNGLEPREIDLKGNVLSKINNQASDKLSNYALTKNTKVVDLGSLTWETKTTDTAGVFRMVTSDIKQDVALPINTSTNANILCTKYKTISGDLLWGREKGIAIGTPSGDVSIYDPDYNTSDKLESFKKTIRGTLLMYQTKNPTTINTTSFKTFKEDANATISDDNFTSSPNAITETFKPTRSYDFKVNGFSNVVKSSNLLSLPDIEATTIDGITYSVKNGVITFNGTVTRTSALNLWIPLNNSIQKNKTYYKKVFYSNTQLNEGNLWLCKELDNYNDRFQMYYGTIDTTYDITYLMIYIEINKTYTNETYRPMLVEGSTAPTKFEPYFDPYIESFADKKNLLGFDDVEETTTTGGVTYSIKNGVFTLNGTSSKSHNIFINLKKPINSGIYSFNAFTTTGSRADIYLNKPLVPLASLGAPTNTKSNISLTSATQLSVWFPKDEKYDNRTFKPMLVEGDKIPTTFLPYQDKYSVFLNVKGKNLIELKDTEETTTNGVTYSIKDGIITLNGTTTGIFNFKLENVVKVEENQTYYLYQRVENTTKTLSLVSNISNYDEEPTFFQYNNKSKKMTKTGYLTLHLYITNANTTFANAKFYVMLVEGTTAPTEYEPYYSFTKEVLIKQPLRKFDYLTYDGVYRQTNEITLDGSWNVVNNNYLFEDGRFTCSIRNFFPKINNYTEPYSQLYITTTSDLPLLPLVKLQNQKKKGIAVNDGSMIIKLDDSADNSLNNWTVEKVNNYFKQNPITITYKTVDQTFEATSLTRLLFKNGYNKITAFDSINNNAIVEYLEYYKSKGD